jgi:chromosomal replication initiation ATPase DnaA
MKTYSSVEEMREEYARVRARLLQPENAIKELVTQASKMRAVEISAAPAVWTIDVVKLERKPETYKTKIWWHEVIDVVEEEVGIAAFDFMGPRRNQHLLQARLLVYALAADCCTHLSLAAIGRLANKDHTTIMHGAPKGRLHPAYQKLKTALLSRLSPPSGDPELGETGGGNSPIV